MAVLTEMVQTGFYVQTGLYARMVSMARTARERETVIGNLIEQYNASKAVPMSQTIELSEDRSTESSVLRATMVR